MYAVFVVYGSLVPFEYRAVPLDQAWAAFQQVPYLQLGVESRADWIANGVLYVPLGFFGVRALSGGFLRGLAIPVSLGIACVLALAVEFAQIQFPPRTVSQNDLIAEVIGGVIGALSARQLSPWLARFRQAWQKDASRFLRLGLQLYILAYLLYCFFPFDVLISVAELEAKFGSGNVAWLSAADGDVRSVIRATLLLWVELALAIPIGLALHSRRGGVTIQRSMMLGALFGLLIEAGQVFIASGITQGASIVSRAIGVGLGAWLGGQNQLGRSAPIRLWLSWHFKWLLLAYLVLLAVGSGWGLYPWIGWERALAAWEQLRFLPFYYHYYTTEAVALTSLGSVVVMYLPLAMLAWARMVPVTGAVMLAFLISSFFETGRLFMADTHPDPTNVLIASTTVGVIVRLLGVIEGRLRLARTEPSAHAGPQPGSPLPSDLAVQDHGTQPAQAMARRPAVRHALAWTVVTAMLWHAINWPSHAGLLASFIGAAAAAAWSRPASVLFVLPLAMPVLDVAPWSGRFFIDEFDLLCATSFALVIARVRPRLLPTTASLRTVTFGAFGIALTVGAYRSGMGNWDLDLNALSHYYSPLNGLRIAKGALWAWLFCAVYQHLVAEHAAHARTFAMGMAAGLAVTILFIVWERMAMVSPFDFATAYRVTGPFSVMNKGGAYVECFLAVAAAFVLVEMAVSSHLTTFVPATLLALLATYATVVTYSRNGYAALACAFMLALVAGLRARQSRWAKLVMVSAMAAITSGTYWVAVGGHAGERLTNTSRDLDTRRAHWDTALDLRDNDLATSLFGVGLGRYPETHLWGRHTETRAASFTLEPGQGNPFLRLGPGAPIYIEQIVSPPANQLLDLSINLRSAHGKPSLTVLMCRKTLLTSEDCESATISGIDAPGVWQTQYATFPPLPPPRNALAQWVPIKLALVTPDSGQAIDIDNVNLRVQGTRDYLTRNGSFAKGMDRWFFATDVDPPWHIHNLPLAVLFDLGWFGAATGLAILAVSLTGAVRCLRARKVAGLAAFAGLTAFLASGTLNTLIDEPRFLWLFLILAWVCAWHGAPRFRATAATRISSTR